MVDVKPGNKKLWGKAKNIIMEITGAGERETGKILRASRGSAKLGILMKIKDLSYNEAKRLLRRHNGILREALK